MASNLIDAETYDSVITVPDDGDEYLAESVEGAFQSLANRTAYLKKIVDELFTVTHTFTAPVGFANTVGFFSPTIVLGGTTNELQYADTLGVVAPRLRTVCIPPALGVPRTGLAAVYNSSTHLWEVTGAGGIIYPLTLPRGAVITNVQPVLQRGAGSGVQFFTVIVSSQTPNPAGGLSSTLLGSATNALAADAWWTTDSALSGMPAIDNAHNSYRVDVGGNDSHVQAGVRLTYLDPGPRNG